MKPVLLSVALALSLVSSALAGTRSLSPSDERFLATARQHALGWLTHPEHARITSLALAPDRNKVCGRLDLGDGRTAPFVVNIDRKTGTVGAIVPVVDAKSTPSLLKALNGQRDFVLLLCKGVRF